MAVCQRHTFWDVSEWLRSSCLHQKEGKLERLLQSPLVQSKVSKSRGVTKTFHWRAKIAAMFAVLGHRKTKCVLSKIINRASIAPTGKCAQFLSIVSFLRWASCKSDNTASSKLFFCKVQCSALWPQNIWYETFTRLPASSQEPAQVQEVETLLASVLKTQPAPPTQFPLSPENPPLGPLAALVASRSSLT